MTERSAIFSFGGGVDSVGMLVLIARGELPRPERVVMADTSRESSLTWRYINRYVIALLRKLELSLDIAPHSFSRRDLYSSNGDLLLPAYTANGKLPTFCSNEWKQRVVRRYLRQIGYGPEKPVSMWFGISQSEFTRMRTSDVVWLSNAYPLVDMEITRQDLESQISSFGLPVPSKSACWCCPNRRVAEWRYQKLYAPADHALAVNLDEYIRGRDPGHELYLYSCGKPLEEVSFYDEDPGPVDICSPYCMV